MIPPFDHNYVLPPYVGENPTQRAAQSPYIRTLWICVSISAQHVLELTF